MLGRAGQDLARERVLLDAKGASVQRGFFLSFLIFHSFSWKPTKTKFLEAMRETAHMEGGSRCERVLLARTAPL